LASRSQVEAIIREEFASAGLDPNLGVAIGKHESGLNPEAVNMTGGDLRRGGSFGPMQMSLATARDLGFTGTTQELMEPRTNTGLAAKLVKQLSGRFSDPKDIISAYNSGRPLSQAPASTREQYVPGVLSHLSEKPASSVYSPPAEDVAADPWTSPPTEREMKSDDPWAAPPTGQEMNPGQETSPKQEMSPRPAVPSGLDKLANGPPSTLGLIRQGADWLSGKQAEADARVAQEHPAAAPYLKLFGALGGMGVGAGLGRGGTVLPKSMSASAAAAPPATGGNAGATLLKAVKAILEPKKTAIKTLEGFLAKKPQPPYASSEWTSTAGVRAPPEPLPTPEAASVPQVQPAQAPAPTPPPAQAPAPPSPFEAAGRAKKVAELTKAIDANASAHLGVDPQDPRFGEALAGLPPEWWEGMGQVAKVNKPSSQTISEVLKFYQDRASQRGSVLPLSRKAK
jgi:hypothetical protein